MDIEEYLNKNKIKYIPIKLIKDENNKIIAIQAYNKNMNSYKMFKDYSYNEFEVFKNQINNNINDFDLLAIDTYEYQIIDIDKDNYKEQFENFKDQPYYLSRNKRLPHYIVKLKNINNESSRTEFEYGDILHGQWSWCKLNEKVINYDKKINAYNYSSFSKNNNNNNLELESKYLKLKKYINKLSQERKDKYNKWIMVLYCIKYICIENKEIALKICDEFSKDSKKYKGFDDVKKHFNQIKSNNENSTQCFEKLKKMHYNDQRNEKKETEEDFELIYNNTKQVFEETIFKINELCLFCEQKDDKYVKYTKQELLIRFENYKNIGKRSFINMWLKDEKLRAYDNFDCLFTMPNNNIKMYNTFNGFNAEKYKLTNNINDDLTFLLNHIKRLCGNDMNCFNYVINWMSYLIKFTHIKNKMTALVFISKEEGCGKSMFFNWLAKKIIGHKYSSIVSNEEQIFNNYAIDRYQKCFILFNETKFDMIINNNEKLKQYISDIDDTYNQKYMKQINCYNFNHYVFLSNNDNPVQISQHDRRFMVFEIPTFESENINKNDYMNRLDNLLNNDNDNLIAQFYNHLINNKIDINYNFEYNRPKNEIYNTIQDNSIKVPIRFISEIAYHINEYPEFYSNKKDENIKIISYNDFFRLYNEYVIESKYKIEHNKKYFKDQILTIEPFKKYLKNGSLPKIKHNTVNVFKFNYDELIKYLIKNKKIDDNDNNDDDEYI